MNTSNKPSDDTPTDVTGETVTSQKFDAAVTAIKEKLQAQNATTLEIAKMFFDTWRDFEGYQKELADRVGMDKGMLNKYVKVGGTTEFYQADVRDKLPGGIGLLHELSFVKSLGDAIIHGEIHGGLSREDIKALRQMYAKKAPFIKPSPPTQPLASATSSPSIDGGHKASVGRRYRERLPDGICAVIQMPEDRAQERAIQEALYALRQAGVEVHDLWSILNKKEFEEANPSDAPLIRKLERAVRKRRTKMRRRTKKGADRDSWDNTFGKDGLSYFDGTMVGVEKAYRHYNGDDFESLVRDVEMAMSKPKAKAAYVSPLPVFAVDPDEPEEIVAQTPAGQELLDKMKAKKVDPKRFDNIDFS